MLTLIARFRGVSLLACLLLFVSLAPLAVAAAIPPVDAPGLALSVEEHAVWALVANARMSAGLSVPPIDVQTTVLARARSADMATRRYFGHASPDGTTFLDLMPTYGITGQLAGETIQENNYADSPAEAARALIASPEHHAILFDPRFTIAGVGHAVGTNGTHYFTIIVVQP
ncbi:MAG: CAP domain-containing protein [Chloroflexota bacterium]|nr:CAP domain-containing protein [Chloroflexota bacterium]